MSGLGPSASRASCVACGGSGRHWARRAGRDLVRCEACGLIWVPDGLLLDEQGATIYEGERPIFLQDGNEQYYLDETNTRSCREKLAWVRTLVPPGARLLDVGASFGHFLSVARPVYAAAGLELSAAAVEWSRQRFAVENHVGSVYAIPPALAGPHDAVTLWDVIEHVPRPGEALEALAAVLRPGGLLFLSTPDAGSVVARLLRGRWHYVDPVQHLALFNARSLGLLLERAGFAPLERRSLGHFYRVGYVLDRLAYLHRGGATGALTAALRLAGGPARRATIRLDLGDVMGVVARRR
ncbi:MAG: class I SAM-dependent methyltransferase [Planctomycetes bacterium]|nr:class I SAM-dependent methyltransferase [Planctomycetota bacterium]